MNISDIDLGSEYRCPICGGNVQHWIHPTNPPQDHFQCEKCGRHKDIWQKPPEQKLAPFGGTV